MSGSGVAGAQNVPDMLGRIRKRTLEWVDLDAAAVNLCAFQKTSIDYELIPATVAPMPSAPGSARRGVRRRDGTDGSRFAPGMNELG